MNTVLVNQKAGFIQQLQYLDSGYFAMAMATGIVSIACLTCNLSFLGYTLFLINIAIYFICSLIYVIRLLNFPTEMFEQVKNQKEAMGFFTIVAASCVLGEQFILFSKNLWVAIIFNSAAIMFWLFLMFFINILIIFNKQKPDLAGGINGTWLLSVVSTQSLVVLGASILTESSGIVRLIGLFICICLWLFGVGIYMWIITLIYYRYMFFPITPAEIEPAHWIDMGAMAIATLAGYQLIKCLDPTDNFYSILPFFQGLMLFCWSVASWWLPVSFILGLIKVFSGKTDWYEPSYWSIVFPIGMYTVCTFKVAECFHLSFLNNICTWLTFISVAVWSLVFLRFCCSKFIRGKYA